MVADLAAVAARSPSMRRFTTTQIALGVAGLVILILVILLLTGRDRSGPAGSAATNDSASAEAPDLAGRCASQATYDRIKRELFRRAAATRGGQPEIFDRLSAYASVRVERPLMTGLDRELGTLRCSGRLSVDLPPGTAVAGGRRTLSADIDYVLQPAADGSGDVVLLEGADPIVVPLATVARTGETAPPVAQPSPSPTEPSDLSPPVAEEPLPAPTVTRPPVRQAPPPVVEPRQPQASAARPSFNCRYARTGSEIAICGDSGLASLDRAMSAQFYRALSAADAGKRRQLTVSRDRFLRYRDRCGSNACIADAYRGRIAEIDEIMARP